MDFIVWGTGKRAKKYYEKIYRDIDSKYKDNLIGFVDSNKAMCGLTLYELPIYAPEEILCLEHDYVEIWVGEEAYDEIIEKLHNMPYPNEKIKETFWAYKKEAFKAWMNSGEAEKIQFAKKWMKKTFGAYGFKENNQSREYELLYDSQKELNYIIFEDKRMYFPLEKSGKKGNDGKYYISDIWYEQDENSPHLYEKGDIVVNDGDIVIDAGVCEGNFALHNIDKIKKLYLIECDSRWEKPLKATFEPYKEKVVFCNKFLSEYDSEETICLDSLIEEKGNNIFLKMDIEGEEVKALKGAQNVLTNNTMKCSICTYHRHDDEKQIRMLLSDCNIEGKTSDGWMFFIWDKEVLNSFELRRGVFRGRSC